MQKVRPKVIISAEKVVIEVGAYDEHSSKVIKVPGESKYWSCLADVVPHGELENRGECDKRVNILDMEGGGLAEDVQNRETNREETTEHKQCQTRTANWSEPNTAYSGVELEENSYTEARWN